ncbi:MAG: 3-deoxy-D-manno-octulosonic acid transferase [Deltaproteobacteria bacterium]|nr:3-deoxy-D-manno-octulosonic acid transferase [Deltaproteobacteria bacterium]
MGLLYRFYTIFTGGIFLLLSPALFLYARLSRSPKPHVTERLGFMPGAARRPPDGGPRIWIHAVSLGEVRVGRAIAEALKGIVPGLSLVISSTTPHGRSLAREIFEPDVPVVYAPLDVLISVRKALSLIRPDAMVFLETEIWPAWIREARRMGITTAIVNGRISVRSIDGYLRLRPFFREVLKNVDLFSMILEEDSARIRAMGADPAKIEINGNAKYDLLAASPDPAVETKMRQVLNLAPAERVIVAGSTRRGEEEMILTAYLEAVKRFPDTILILVPRHIDRASEIGALIADRGLGYQLRTEIGPGRRERTEKIVIINTFGELFNIYSVATVVFCGASLVPLGGQNPLEPAAWGRPVLYGPSMEDFQDAKELLEGADAALPIATPEELGEKILYLFDHPAEARAGGPRLRDQGQGSGAQKSGCSGKTRKGHRGASQKREKIFHFPSFAALR